MEKPPEKPLDEPLKDPSTPADFKAYKKRKQEKESKFKEQENLLRQMYEKGSNELPDTKSHIQSHRRKYFENEICKIGDDKWMALSEFAKKTGVIFPKEQDKYRAKLIRQMTDEAIISYFKDVYLDFMHTFPLSSKTLCEEIEGRMKGNIS